MNIFEKLIKNERLRNKIERLRDEHTCVHIKRGSTTPVMVVDIDGTNLGEWTLCKKCKESKKKRGYTLMTIEQFNNKFNNK